MKKWPNLQRHFQSYNRKYFNNTLENIPVKWSDFSQEDAMAMGVFRTQSPHQIEISVKLRSRGTLWRLTLLHEMCHQAVKEAPDEKRYRVKHSPSFNNEMRRLANLGAFDSLW